MKTIVALVDLSDLALGVLRQAGQFASAFNAKLVILHVVPRQPAMLEVYPLAPVGMRKPSQEVLDSHHAKLQEMRDALVREGVPSTIEQLVDLSSKEVLAETKRLKADLIVLGSHPHSTFYHLVIGSMADDVLKNAPCPVVVVPEKVQAPADT
ncbi:universal stress protein [Prosthecobacter sp.]|uniref:universal stress protein n=1 Tax=Prosthecobacter sp. TaxID=1965333 RepID=UPI0037841A7A